METSASLNAYLSSHQRRPRAVDATLVAGVHQAPAGARLDRQVDADAQQLARFADAAHVLAVGEALAQAPHLVPVLRAEHLDERHRLSSAASPTGPAGAAVTAGGGRTAGGALQPASGAGRVLGDGPLGGTWPMPASGARGRAPRCPPRVALRAGAVAVGGARWRGRRSGAAQTDRVR